MSSYQNQFFDLGAVDWEDFEQSLRDGGIRQWVDYHVAAKKGQEVTLRFKMSGDGTIGAKANAALAKLIVP